MLHGRRQMLWLGVTTHPTAEWIARQLTEGHLEKISPYGVMTGVRFRSAVDRSILGLSSRLPEVATGFSGGGLIGSTHATQRVARRFTRPRRPSFQDKRGGACCRQGSSFRSCTARERCRWCARARLPCRSFDHQIHARRGRAPSSASYWRPSAPHRVRDCDRPCDECGSSGRVSELFLDLIAAIDAVGPHVRSRVARINPSVSKCIFTRRI